MTAVAGHVTAGAQRPPGPRRMRPGPPRLAEGVEPLGKYQGSGYRQPPSLVRRADGQVIQMSPLLYQVACRIDGFRDPSWPWSSASWAWTGGTTSFACPLSHAPS